MKTSTLILAGVLTALSAAPGLGQTITLTPGAGSGIVSSEGATFNNHLTLQLTFGFNATLGQMSVRLNNLGNVANASAKYNISHWGFNSPAAWGSVSLTAITPVSPNTWTGGITSLTGSTAHPVHLFGSYYYAHWVGRENANGSGSGDKVGELGIDQGEATDFLFTFAPIGSGPIANFNLSHFFSDNVGSDLGFRIQPMSGCPDSDKWAVSYTVPPDLPPDIPPLTPVPEPATYGLIGMAGLASLIGFRKLRRKA